MLIALQIPTGSLWLINQAGNISIRGSEGRDNGCKVRLVLRLVEKRKKCVSRVLECYNLKVKDTMETKNIWSGNIKSKRD